MEKNATFAKPENVKPHPTIPHKSFRVVFKTGIN
jgi:hypothetical protein